jgi:hypothetical protein
VTVTRGVAVVEVIDTAVAAERVGMPDAGKK